MLPSENLKSIRYMLPDDKYTSETRFAGIAMLESFVDLNKKTKIITVRTDDDNKRTEECYALFKEELARLSICKETDLCVTEEIVVPHNEEGEKENLILRKLFESFSEKSDVFLDLTFGTKLTSVEMFSSLFYAEIAKNCSIKKVVYGKFPFGDNNVGELFDATNLYRKIRLLETARFMEKNAFDDLVEKMLI